MKQQFLWSNKILSFTPKLLLLKLRLMTLVLQIMFAPVSLISLDPSRFKFYYLPLSLSEIVSCVPFLALEKNESISKLTVFVVPNISILLNARHFSMGEKKKRESCASDFWLELFFYAFWFPTMNRYCLSDISHISKQPHLDSKHIVEE